MEKTRGSKASDLALKVMRAKDAWEDSKLQREQAQMEYEFAEKRLILARQALELERSRMLPDDDWDYELTLGIEYPEDVLGEVKSVEFVGQSIGQAARSSLARLGHATAANLATHMGSRGFQFSSDAPTREVHGALMKQAWAMKNRNTDEWEYREGE